MSIKSIKDFISEISGAGKTAPVAREEEEVMYLIVGLGNPGKEYDMTRHNIGFHTIDYVLFPVKMSPDNSLYKMA